MVAETLTLGLPFDHVEDVQDTDETQSRLGKGLATILDATNGERTRRGGLASLIPVDHPTANSQTTALLPPRLEHEGRHDSTDLASDLVRALLDGLGSSMPLDLCAYVHQDRTDRPRMHLRSPAFASFSPTDGFELCDLLGRRLRKGQSGAFDAAGFVGLTVATAGLASSGIFAVGRRRGVLGRPEADSVETFCRQLGASVHQMAEHHPAPAPMPGLMVDIAEAALGAEATVRLDTTPRPRVGHAWAGGRVEAVATALLKAIGCGRMFRYASEIEIDGERRALVLLQGDDGTASLRGATAPGGSAGEAVALATYRAAAALLAGDQP